MTDTTEVVPAPAGVNADAYYVTVSLAGTQGPPGPAGTAWYNVVSYGADKTGVADSAAAINAAITAAKNANGGVVYFPPGSYAVSTPPNLAGCSNVVLMGDQATYLKPMATFAGSAGIVVTGGDSVTIEDIVIQFSSSNYASNPAADGITVAHSTNFNVFNVDVQYANGWALSIYSDATGDSFYPVIENVHPYHCKGGINLQATASADHMIGALMNNIILDNCQVNAGLNIQDAWDVQVDNLESSGNLGPVIQISGTGGAVMLDSLNLGSASTTQPAFLIQNIGVTAPSNIMVSNSLLQQGKYAAQITAGTQISFVGCTFQQAQNHGLWVSGAADEVIINGCTFTLNGKAAAPSNYDLLWASTGNVLIVGSVFNSAIGAAAGQVKASSSFTAGTSVVAANLFARGQGTAYDSTPTFPMGNSGDTWSNFQTITVNNLKVANVQYPTTAPTVGQILQAISATAIGWQTLLPTDVQFFPATGTWTKPAGAVSVEVLHLSGGGGGQAGGIQPAGTAAMGGGAGQGGNFVRRIFKASDLPATVAVTINTLGQGGAAVSGTTPSVGPNGSYGGNVLFGNYTNVAGGTPGGVMGNGVGGAAGNGAIGAPVGYSGGNGGNGAAGTGTNPAGFAAGGGGGGGVSAAGAVFNGGGSGGSYMAGSGTGVSGGQGGVAGGALPVPVVNPTIAGTPGPGGGGGASAASGTAQSGALGGYGGGGGGGGAMVAGASNSSGAGGNGGPGWILVITYFT